MPKVSIVIPVYNVEKYLKQCLESVASQTLKDIEVICVNDGSTDHSLEILEEYAQHDERIKVINKVNTGYGHTMNVGVSKTNGEYIGVLESDDFVDRDMFEKLYFKAIEYSAEVVKSNYMEYKNGEDYLVESLRKLGYEQIFSPNQNQEIFHRPASIWSAIYKREFLLKNNIGFNETPGASYQDTSFNFKVLACTERMLLLKDAFLHYRTDNVNSSVNSIGKVYCVCDEYKEIYQFLDERADLKERVKFLVEGLKYKTYQWNYTRLLTKYKIGFLKQVADELIVANDKGVLNKNYWEAEDWDNVCDLLRGNKEEWIYSIFAQSQKQRMYCQVFLQEIKKFKQIYIYGAGLVGKSVAEYLSKKEITVNSFIVSNKNENEIKILNIPVYALDELELDKDTSIILVATKEKDQTEIIKNLYKFGFDHVIAMSLELRKSLA